jgi:hypothetical protein
VLQVRQVQQAQQAPLALRVAAVVT